MKDDMFPSVGFGVLCATGCVNRGVIGNPMTIVLTLNDSAKMNDTDFFEQVVCLSFAKAKEKQPYTQANDSCVTFYFAYRTPKNNSNRYF
jgi:hypothetical protein